MRVDAMPSHCDVLGCDLPAADAYLHAVKARLVEFSVCAGHVIRLTKGRAPRVVTECTDLEQGNGRIMLVLAPPQDPGDR